MARVVPCELSSVPAKARTANQQAGCDRHPQKLAVCGAGAYHARAVRMRRASGAKNIVLGKNGAGQVGMMCVDLRTDHPHPHAGAGA